MFQSKKLSFKCAPRMFDFWQENGFQLKAKLWVQTHFLLSLDQWTCARGGYAQLFKRLSLSLK